MRNEDPEKVLRMYRGLWRIEELFRISKHTLRMRPMHHRMPRRIRAHVLICFLAYAVLRYSEMVLKKGSCLLSPQKIIEELKEAESFIIQDRRKNGKTYRIPRSPSKTISDIYAAFRKSIPQTPCMLE